METQGRQPQKLTKDDLKILKQLSTPSPQKASAEETADRKVNRIILRRLIEVLQDEDESKAA